MDFHLLEFFGRQFSGLRNDVLRNGQFTNVMQKRGGAQSLSFVGSQAQIFGKFHGINAHSLKMLMGDLILSFDSQS